MGVPELVRKPGYFWLLLVVLFAVFLLGFDYIWRLYHGARVAEAEREWLVQANRQRVLLESEITTSAFLATGVESYIVARQGLLDGDEIEQILALLYDRGRHFRNIGIAPDNRIAWVFPLAGNEAALGLDYRLLPAQWPDIERMMQTRAPKMAGPIDLVQGGRGLIYRAPIFIADEYWGLLSTVIGADSLFSLLNADDALAPRLALRVLKADGEPGPVFWGEANAFDTPLDILDIRLPGALWQMAVQAPASHGQSGWVVRPLGVLAAFLLALLIALSIRLLVQRKMLSHLDNEVQARTAQLRQSHDLIASVLSSAKAFAIIVTDEQGKIVLFNSGAELMLGYAAQEVLGQGFLRRFMLVSEVREQARILAEQQGHPVAWHQVFAELAQQGDQQSRILHYRHRDGHLIPVQLVVSTLAAADGSHAGFLAIAEDISERMRNENLKNQFVSTVSHELRTPLTAINGALGLLRSGAAAPVPAALKPMLAIASNNSQRLTQLVNDLLDIEKLMAGRMPLALKPCRVDHLVSSTLTDLQMLAQQKGIVVQAEPVVSESIIVDPLRFQQVLTNLISNAIKFSPPGTAVSVAVSTQQGEVRIAVSDQGPGIPAAFKPFVFQRFAQADAGDTRLQPGTGLGLAISKELVEQMGGRIGFESAEGQGSCFWLEFARVDGDDNG